MADEQPRGVAFAEAQARVAACTRCPALVASRSRVLVGAGAADADVLLVTGAPSADEDALGLPLVGSAGALLDRLLSEAGLARADVFVTPLVKCLPPAGRDPSPGEVARCSEHLVTQVERLRPVVVVTLGAFATKLLRGDPAAIRERRGREEIRTLGTHPFWLLPVFDPAAALYGPELIEQLRADIARLPELVARGKPQARSPAPTEPEPAVGPAQLGLF